MKKQKGKNQKWEFTRKDYRKYQFTVKEAAKYLLEGAVICAAVDYLFYAGTAVYASPAGTFSENTEKEMHCSPEKKSELSVP